ncbi:MAG: hypothetical protein EXQ54_00600 [Acidobacteria bacterium]|nr:hypothetical protein [Acidobacteriota bacterium]
MLDEHGDQLQRVDLRARSAAAALADLVELGPRPAFVILHLDRLAGHLALDDRRIEDARRQVGRTAALPVDAAGRKRVFRTVAARHARGRHHIRLEAECPQQAAGCHLGVHLAVLLAVLDLDLVGFCERAPELRRQAGERLLGIDKRACRLRANAVGRAQRWALNQIQRGGIDRLPDARPLHHLLPLGDAQRRERVRPLRRLGIGGGTEPPAGAPNKREDKHGQRNSITHHSTTSCTPCATTAETFRVRLWARNAVFGPARHAIYII